MSAATRSLAPLAGLGLALLLCTACPPKRPASRPRPEAFDPMIARRALEARVAELEAAPGAGPLARAAARRDLGILRWVHFGDAAGARADLERALAEVDRARHGGNGARHGARARGARPASGARGATPRDGVAAPFARAALALMADLDLAVSRAAEAWLAVLADLARARRQGARQLPPPPGADPDALAELAADRLGEQLRHLPSAFGAEALDALADAPLPPLVRAALAQVRLGRARLAGDLAAMRRHAAAAGCAPHWALSPRYGQHPRLDLATASAPERGGALAERALPADGCSLTLRAPDGRSGVRYAEATFESPRGGPALVQLAYPAPVILFLNGARVHGPDPEEVPLAPLRVVPVTLRPGANLVRVKLPVSASPRRLHLLVAVDPAGVAPRSRSRSRSRASTGAGGAEAARRAGPRPAPRHAMVRTGRGSRRMAARVAAWLPVSELLRVMAALHRGLPDAGRASVERMLALAPRFPWGRFAAARLEELDPLQPAELGRARARPLLARELSDHPAAARARLRLASVLRQQGKSKEALALIEAAPAGDPEAARLLGLARVTLFSDLGWRALARREAEALATRHRAWLAAWQLHYRLARLAHAGPAVRRAAVRLRALDATSTAKAALLAREGKLREALAELGRVAALTGGGGSSTEAAWLREAGREAEARRRLAARLARATWDPERRLGLADVLVALGDRIEAIRILEEGLAEHPEQLDLRRALTALGRPHPMAAFRVRGAEAIATWRKSAWRPGNRPVYVLDRAVMRVLPSGGRLELTHQIVHLGTKEAVHRYAEVNLPPGAEVLTLRTVKADGSTREPEEIGGKQSVSLPDVDVGDFIEAEYVTASAPEPWWQPGGFYGTTFSFRSLAAHFFRSELVVVSNPGAGPGAQPRARPGVRPGARPGARIILESTGPVPKAVVTRVGDLEVTTFAATRMERLEPEPLAASLVGVLPQIRMGAGVTIPGFLRQRRELAWGLAAATHRVRALGRALCRGTPAERARKTYDWVQANVEESGGLFASAAATAARRSGSRANLLRALLRVCGLPEPELLLVWPRHQEHPLGAGLPALAGFSQAVLRITVPGEGPVFVLPQVQQAPFGYLPPMLQGSLAVSLARPDAPPERLPERPEAELHETRLKIVLRPDGAAVVAGEDRLRGLLGLQMRAALRRVPERRLRQVLEQVFFGRHFAGATLTQLQFEGAEDPAKPLLLRYRLEVPALARATPGRLALRAELFPSRVGRQFGALPSRRLPLLLGPMGPRHLVAEIEAPAGYRFLEQPASLRVPTPGGTVRITAQSTKEPVALDTPYGALRVSLTRTPAGVRLERRSRVPFRVVPPEAYPTFTALAAAFDRLEAPLLVFGR